jgi:hypothetical protein
MLAQLEKPHREGVDVRPGDEQSLDAVVQLGDMEAAYF